MSDAKTVECVVVFDHIGVATGETQGDPPLAISTDHFRADKVKLSEEDAKRHLASGAVIKASDPRAKQIRPNPPLSGGVTRTIDAVPLEESAPAVSAGEGAVKETGTEAELKGLGVAELKQRAAEVGVLVERGDTKPKLIAKLVAHSSAQPAGLEEGKGPDETVNPGQGTEPVEPAAAEPAE